VTEAYNVYLCHRAISLRQLSFLLVRDCNDEARQIKKQNVLLAEYHITTKRGCRGEMVVSR